MQMATNQAKVSELALISELKTLCHGPLTGLIGTIGVCAYLSIFGQMHADCLFFFNLVQRS